jgi:hypothetical protein
MEDGADAARGDYGPAPTPVQLVETLARVHGLLDLAITADTELLTARIAGAGRDDIVLTVAEAVAYERRRAVQRYVGLVGPAEPVSCTEQPAKVPMRREGDGSGKRSSTAFRQRVDTLREANGAQWLLMG